MEAVEAILSEVDKLQPDQKRQLLHQLVDRMLTASSTLELSIKPDFEKYVGIGRGVWKTDAQTYVNEIRRDERF